MRSHALRPASLLALLLALPGGCATQTSKSNHGIQQVEKLLPGDTIIVSLNDLPQSPWQELPERKIDNDGLIDLPLGETVKVADLTVEEAANTIRKHYALKYLGKAGIRVKVKKVQPDGAALGR